MLVLEIRFIADTNGSENKVNSRNKVHSIHQGSCNKCHFWKQASSLEKSFISVNKVHIRKQGKFQETRFIPYKQGLSRFVLAVGFISGNKTHFRQQGSFQKTRSISGNKVNSI
jgi:hypothetical protein